jgi:hypothetical protein
MTSTTTKFAARDIDLTADLAEHLSRNKSRQVRSTVARHRVTPAAVIARLALDDDDVVRANAFKHARMTTEGLSAAAPLLLRGEQERLADYRKYDATPPDVKAFVSSPMAPSDSLREFASLEYIHLDVHHAIATNLNTPIDVLLQFTESEIPEIRKRASANPSFNRANLAEYLAPGDAEFKAMPKSWLLDMARLKMK